MASPSEPIVPDATPLEPAPSFIPAPSADNIQKAKTTGITLLIDNYDSFTHNLYQFLEQLGANCRVVRNDQITIEEIELEPIELLGESHVKRRTRDRTYFSSGLLKNIVISPGPGHPRTDSGVSRAAIRWGLGKLPILGVCMGLQCLVDELGGEIGFAGEIVHGKTSLIKHDGKGLFHSLPQDLKSTRYHSLACSLKSLPSTLTVTSTTESGVVMGVRHREFTVEAVQYHPESVMSEGGMELMGNFLNFTGGRWTECPGFGVTGESSQEGAVPQVVKEADQAVHSQTATSATPQPDMSSSHAKSSSSLPTILTQIHEQRLQDVSASQSHLSSTPAQLQTNVSLHLSPSLIPLLPRILSSAPQPAVFAEVKRASPSKGNIAPDTNAAAQALKYAHAGASVISVLTEPKWFKGSLMDMLAVRTALGEMPNRPAVLRKDFILSTYQIDEARLYGADTILLIVAMLSPSLLVELYNYSVSQGMEPLVEVNNVTELERAIELGAKVIGVNNRNLHDFEVDMSTTSRVNEALSKKGGDRPVLVALSGITGRQSVEGYLQAGVQGLLVGESLMRAADPKDFIDELLGRTTVASASSSSSTSLQSPLVKICGIQSITDAQIAIDAGADLLGLIFVAKSKRQVDLSTAFGIAQLVRSTRFSSSPTPTISTSSSIPSPSPRGWFDHHTSTLSRTKKPLLVGVFQNQPLDHILDVVSSIGLDLVQLHGTEPAEWASFIPVPVIKVFHVDPATSTIGSASDVPRPGKNQFILLDAGKSTGEGGGKGEKFDWSVARELVRSGGSSGGRLPLILAGGLNEDNVEEAVNTVGPWCVDVSSGVERRDGIPGKDEERCRLFVTRAKAATC